MKCIFFLIISNEVQHLSSKKRLIWLFQLLGDVMPVVCCILDCCSNKISSIRVFLSISQSTEKYISKHFHTWLFNQCSHLTSKINDKHSHVPASLLWACSAFSVFVSLQIQHYFRLLVKQNKRLEEIILVSENLFCIFQYFLTSLRQNNESIYWKKITAIISCSPKQKNK